MNDTGETGPEATATDVTDLEERLADAQAEMERLQAAAADAEARATQHRQLAVDLQSRLSTVEEDLAETAAERDRLAVEAADLRQWLTEAAARYRLARLAAAPEVPEELVRGDSLDEIDAQLEAAQRIVSEMRGRMEAQAQPGRVPIGSPPRREADLSGLSSQEKIRLGLERSSRP